MHIWLATEVEAARTDTSCMMSYVYLLTRPPSHQSESPATMQMASLMLITHPKNIQIAHRAHTIKKGFTIFKW